MTKREKAGVVLVITGFLLVLLGCCLVADNPYWWVSVASSNRMWADRPGSVRAAQGRGRAAAG
ncbi:MAG: hypothetical protein ACLTKQ_08330 [Acutalibacteraceae bacterium]